MKALTVCQPYASLVMSGEKRVENRTWPSNYRGPLLIHAGKSRQWLPAGDPGDYPYGAILGRVELVDCVQMRPPFWSSRERDSIDAATERYPWLWTHEHATGPWCWILESPKPFDHPVPYRGRQGLFEVPDNAVQNRI